MYSPHPPHRPPMVASLAFPPPRGTSASAFIASHRAIRRRRVGVPAVLVDPAIANPLEVLDVVGRGRLGVRLLEGVRHALTPCLGVQRTPAHLLDLRLIDLLRLDPCERDPCEMTCDFRRFKRKEWPVLFRPSPAGFDSTANASRRRTNHQLLLVTTARFTTNSGSSVPSSPASAFLAVITDIAARDVSVMAAV